MPHATECTTNLLNNAPTLSSSPISIPNSGSSFSASTVPTRSTTINNLSDYNFNSLSLQDADNMNLGFDQSYSTVFSSDENMYTPTVTSNPVARSLYPRDYNCCGVDHQTLLDLYQHVDNCHPGLINDLVNGVFPFDSNTVYSQDRWDHISTLPTLVHSVPIPSMPNSSAHEQKNNNFSTVTSASLYFPSILNHKQKGNVNNNGLGQSNGYNQSGSGQINGFDQIDGATTLSCDHLMLALLYDNNSANPLRDPNVSLFVDQTLSSNSSSISSSLNDDNSLFDIPSKALQMNQDPLLVSPLLSISSYPATPIDTCLQSAVSSPVSSDDNSLVVSPITNDQSTTQDNRHSPLQNTSYGSVNNNSPSSRQGPLSSSNNDAKNGNSRTSSTDQHTSYGSRQRSISPRDNDAHSHVTAQQRPNSQSSSFNHVKIEGSIGSSSADANKTHHITQRSFLQTSSIDGNSISPPRRSSTTIIPSQSNEQQYGSINMSSLVQGNISSSRPIAQLRRSSTSNLMTARSVATTSSQTYGSLNIPIDKTKLAYLPSAAQYSVNTVNGYSIVGHVSSGETGSGAVTPFTAKYHPIQPKAGVAMSDVYSDPALDVSGIKSSKKRNVSTSPVDSKSKRRVTKSSDESVAETPVAVMPADLSSEVENNSDTDVYPYKCAVPGCPKVYKNANGLKYHNEHGHASQSGNGAREKPWACRLVGCLKTYGSKGGLIYHVKHCHPNDLWALP